MKKKQQTLQIRAYLNEIGTGVQSTILQHVNFLQWLSTRNGKRTCRCFIYACKRVIRVGYSNS